jgi:hypothetical protein
LDPLLEALPQVSMVDFVKAGRYVAFYDPLETRPRVTRSAAQSAQRMMSGS